MAAAYDKREDVRESESVSGAESETESEDEPVDVTGIVSGFLVSLSRNGATNGLLTATRDSEPGFKYVCVLDNEYLDCKRFYSLVEFESRFQLLVYAIRRNIKNVTSAIVCEESGGRFALDVEVRFGSTVEKFSLPLTRVPATVRQLSAVRMKLIEQRLAAALERHERVKKEVEEALALVRGVTDDEPE